MAVLLSEPGAGAIANRLADLEFACASPLLEAELLAVAAREGIDISDDMLRPLHWITPPRRLTAELRRGLSSGSLRGADAWHLATALYFFSDPANGFFLTLDSAQRTAARHLGFSTEWSAL